MTEKEIFRLIQKRAYDIWELNKALDIPDNPVENWLKAEKEITSSLFLYPFYTREDEA